MGHARMTQRIELAERRTAPRTSTRIPVLLKLRGFPDPLPARAVDIGTSGICVSTPSRFLVADLTAVTFELGNDRVTIPAEGRWQRLDNSGRGHVAGLMFVDVGRSVASALRDFVLDHAAQTARFLLEETALTGLDLDDAIDTALLTRAADYPVGRRIYEQGKERSRGDSVFIVEHGSVVLEAQIPGAGRILLDSIDRGAIFAGLPLLTDAAHMESAIASSDLRLIEIDPYSFATLEGTRPRVARRLARAIVQRRASARWAQPHRKS